MRTTQRNKAVTTFSLAPTLRVACALAAVVTSSRAQEGATDELIAQGRVWLEGAGSVLVTYEQESADGKGVGRRTIGFDPATGAWFFADYATGASGRTPDGTLYAPGPASAGIGPGAGSLPASKVSPVQESPHVSKGIDDYIPIALIVNMRESSAGLRSVDRTDGGNWTIAHEGPTADPNTMRVTRVTFGPQGEPIRIHVDADPTTGRDEIAFEYEIEPDSPPAIAIVKQRQISPLILPPRLVDIQYYPESRPELFTMSAAESLAADNQMRTRMRLNGIAARGAVGGSEEHPAPAPYAKSSLGRAAWPLVVTGIIVVGIGIVVLIRTKAGR